MELPLAEFFLSKLIGRNSDVGVHHLASLDPVMYKNLLFLKNYEGDVSELGLDFTVVNDELGETKVGCFQSYFNLHKEEASATFSGEVFLLLLLN